MRSFRGLARCLTAVFGLSAHLVFSVPEPAIAGQRGVRSEDAVAGRHAGSAREDAALIARAAADSATRCVKCHNSCENGRSHEGLSAAGNQENDELPLTAEGRTTCFTCHQPHREGEAATGPRLRMSNLRRELCLACHLEKHDNDLGVQVVSPLERAVVFEDRLALIGKVSRTPGSPLTVKLNGAAFNLPLKGMEFYTLLKLRDGTNSIEVVQEGLQLWRGEVFRGENAVARYERTTSGHRTENREQCLACHQKLDELGATATDATRALCYSCHDRNDEKRYVHGPLAVGDCLACHDPHGGFGASHLRREQAQLCANCHAPGESATTMVCAAGGKGCVDCHDPHQSDARYLLKGPQYTMRDLFTPAR